VAVAAQAREVGEGAHHGTTRHTGSSGRSSREPFEATVCFLPQARPFSQG
jgi:hypothetical protein